VSTGQNVTFLTFFGNALPYLAIGTNNKETSINKTAINVEGDHNTLDIKIVGLHHNSEGHYCTMHKGLVVIYRYMTF
jgi:hypothetical protein